MVRTAEIVSSILTDHSLVTVSFEFIEDKRGPGFWKMNCSILNDIEYVQIIKEVIKTTINDGLKNKLSHSSLWELIKFNVKVESRKYTTEKNKKENSLLQYYEEKLNNLKESLSFYSDNQEKERIQEEIQFTENLSDKLLEKYAKAAMIRSRSKFYEDGEKNTKYFSNLEKRNQSNKYIKILINDKGQEINTGKEILKEEVKFYSLLYKSKESFKSCPIEIKDAFLKNVNIPKLNTEEKNTLEGNIRVDECQKVLKTMKNNKSPGLDGIPFEFYKLFWCDIKDIFVKSVNENFEKGKMSTTQRQSVISLIPKGKKDVRYLKHWRPISLLNCDYKIATKVIAYRLREFLPKLISHDQTGFVKDRYIGENIRTIIDILDYTEENDIPGLIFSVDFEKAFDSLDWDYLYETLKVFGFGPNIIKWVKTFYNDISSRTVNNGWASESFQISRGLRQGCPLSPYLYVICAELLAVKLRNSENVEGINILDTIFLLCQFADDTQIFLKGTENVLNAALENLEMFEKCSGLKINYDKSECFKIGSLRTDRRQFTTIHNLKWSKGPINVLGMKIPIIDKKSIFALNLDDIIYTIKNTINLWSKRKLTLIGRVNILKSQLLSKLTYVISVLPNIPQNYLEQIQTLFFNFVWKSKTDKIKRNIQINTIKRGGLSVVDIQSYDKSLKTTWVKRYLSSSKPLWKFFFKNALRNFGESLIFNCDMLPTDSRLSNVSSAFYRDILKNWFALKKMF